MYLANPNLHLQAVDTIFNRWLCFGCIAWMFFAHKSSRYGCRRFYCQTTWSGYDKINSSMVEHHDVWLVKRYRAPALWCHDRYQTCHVHRENNHQNAMQMWQTGYREWSKDSRQVRLLLLNYLLFFINFAPAKQHLCQLFRMILYMGNLNRDFCIQQTLIRYQVRPFENDNWTLTTRSFTIHARNIEHTLHFLNLVSWSVAIWLFVNSTQNVLRSSRTGLIAFPDIDQSILFSLAQQCLTMFSS